MATLYGQNFRVVLKDGNADTWKVVAKATSCTINLVGNTEDTLTKDDGGLSGAPTIISKSWNVSVDSLDVTDMAEILTAIAQRTKFTLLWDETLTTNNQTLQHAAFCRVSEAYMSDVTFTFNNRENATKQVQFIGASALSTTYTSLPQTTVIENDHTFTKGQYVRLFIMSNETGATNKPLAAALNFSIHANLTLEDASTKDTEGDWVIQEPTGFSYDLSATALLRSGETITSTAQAQTPNDMLRIYEEGLPVLFRICNATGKNNRDMGTTIITGQVIITNMTLNGVNRQKADYNLTMQGVGMYSVLQY